ncbi:YdcF family protein [Dyella silvatica]|uniref:YdcF family protein n=1 Tax=Dyella silvatica TaxID=2992128 RepID=UPI002250580F|nr:YdcF family protein [Dyella silvatica]
MTLTVVILLLLLSVALRAIQWRGFSRTLSVLAIVLFFAAGCGPLPAWLLSELQGPYAKRPSNDWAAHNAIVLLGAGTVRIGADGLDPSFFSQGRILRTVELYRDCSKVARDCKVLVSGGDPERHGAAEADVYGEMLKKLGVEAKDLQLESRSMSTWQNAQFSRPLLLNDGAQRVLLVSSGIHLRRSLLYFAHFGMTPTPVRGDYVEALWTIYPSGWNFTLTDAVLHEYIGIARYHVYNALGWNAPRVTAGAASGS